MVMRKCGPVAGPSVEKSSFEMKGKVRWWLKEAAGSDKRVSKIGKISHACGREEDKKRGD